MAEGRADFAAALEAVVCRVIPAATGLANLQRLTGGANKETWSFEATGRGAPVRLILRRAIGGVTLGSNPNALSLANEAAIVANAGRAGVPVPPVRYVLTESDGVGQGFIMDFVAGETIARKILRDAAFDAVRPKLAFQCGAIAARIHAVDTRDMPPVRQTDPKTELAFYYESYQKHGHPHPVFEIAFRWLSDRMPPIPRPRILCHGDFRHGNLIIGPEGVRAALDWENCKFGDPMEDLGWICVTSWRFGSIDKPVGGFGERAELFAGYESAGGKPDPKAQRFWEIMGSLKWGIMCTSMGDMFRNNIDRTVERAAIGRRSSENEIDLLNYLLTER